MHRLPPSPLRSLAAAVLLAAASPVAGAPYAEGEEKSGPAPERRAPGASKGLAAKTRSAAAARAKAGATAAGGKPKAAGKPKPKPGAPRGRAQKLARPGVKPKRASRPSSTRRTPR